jgi:hypothetical protein
MLLGYGPVERRAADPSRDSSGHGAGQDDHRNEQRKYRDAKHHDEHASNDHEDRTYRMWLDEKHRKYAALTAQLPRPASLMELASRTFRHQLKIDIQ